MGRNGTLNLGFFSYLEGDGPATDIYRNVTDLFVQADDLGLDAGWVAQHHFGHHGGLPSPFVFFASIAGQTRQIGLGTAVITPALEDPVRIAEDAAVLETMYPGRLQLGLGTGFATDPVLAVFGKGGQDKRALYDAGVIRLREVFGGATLNVDDDVLYPPAESLNTRLWEAPGSVPRVIQAAQRGSGLLLSRIAIGVTDRGTDEVQRELVDAYYNALPEGVAPRIGLSRSVWPTNDPDAAYESLSAGLLAGVKKRNDPTAGHVNHSLEELFDLYSVHWGKPEAVVESLLAEPLIDEVTDVICQLSPGTPTQEQALEALELLATEVGPGIGWAPARREPAAAAR
jgi:alkanesulfonate monooxygenase SsuD/methylene tetrahydromethanopterin reductase-like flavin-dependent oxidoreductase (luciferase family)